LEFSRVLLEHWRLVVRLPVAVAVVVVVASLVVPPTYTATTSFVPEVRSQSRLPAGLAGLAGQLGISLPSEAVASPRFYAAVAMNRELLERILLSRYPNPRATATADSLRLLELLRVKGRDAADSLQKGVKALQRMVAVRVDNQTNIVRLSVDARYPELAAAVANRFILYLNEFNTETRQSQARERRKFIETRLSEAEQGLRAAEEQLRAFYDRNALWQQSPQLVFQEGRLRRQVDIQQEVYVTLRREYETARIEEVNDTPVITVIERAVPPTERSAPRRGVWVVLALVLGALAAVFLAYGVAYAERLRHHPAPYHAPLLAVMERLRRVVARVRGSRRRPARPGGEPQRDRDED
jgi:uncharacterized protein involved in exopolysaccharide biosynthesis